MLLLAIHRIFAALGKSDGLVLVHLLSVLGSNLWHDDEYLQEGWPKLAVLFLALVSLRKDKSMMLEPPSILGEHKKILCGNDLIHLEKKMLLDPHSNIILLYNV